MKPTNITFPKVVNFDFEGQTYNVYQSAYVEIFNDCASDYVSFDDERSGQHDKIARIGLDLIRDKFKGELK
jgi:hypothetical protein